ncbi:MAG: hypothetical protein SOW59_08510 [Corynebacterium sp.]|nr:hypothetical protein [Corynebacterium sp.]
MTAIDRSVVPEDIKTAALDQFAQTWTSYSSASNAAMSIATLYGIGKTTLIEWARAEGIWPRTRASVAAQLEQENRRLREENAQLRAKLSYYTTT